MPRNQIALRRRQRGGALAAVGGVAASVWRNRRRIVRTVRRVGASLSRATRGARRLGLRPRWARNMLPGPVRELSLKRKMLGPSYPAKRPRIANGQAGASAQYNIVKLPPVGRKRSIYSALQKIDRRSFEYWIQRWGRVAPFNNPTAGLDLPHYSALSTNFYPLHIYEVTNRMVPSSVTGTNNAWFMTGDDATDQINFTPLTRDTIAGGSSTAGWDVVKGFDPNAYQVSNSVMQWVKVDLILRGIATRPTRYNCAFVQFQEVDLLPTAAPNDSRTKFWSDFIQPHLVNPLLRNERSLNSSGRMTVLRQYSFKFNPDETTNKDTIPVQKRVTMFYNTNRYCNWVLKEGPKNANIEDIEGKKLNFEDVQAQSLDNTRLPQPRARVYFLIWADVFDNSEDATLRPQYDIDMRVKHVSRSGAH